MGRAVAKRLSSNCMYICAFVSTCYLNVWFNCTAIYKVPVVAINYLQEMC